jgi:hypothetical protein
MHLAYQMTNMTSVKGIRGNEEQKTEENGNKS